MRDQRDLCSLLFAGQFRCQDAEALDPANYALNQEGKRLVGRINAERNKDAIFRASKNKTSGPRSSAPFLNYTKQYKCYSEQKPLVLSEAERAEVFGVVTSVFEYTNDKRKVVLASHIIVKLFCDMFAAQLEQEGRGMEVCEGEPLDEVVRVLGRRGGCGIELFDPISSPTDPKSE